jgi:hypothetical protein
VPGAGQWSANLTGCARVNTTALLCSLPPGSGAELNVVVTVADQSGIGAGLLSYNAPAISSVSVLNGSLAATVGSSSAPNVSSAAGSAMLSSPTSGGALVPSGPTKGGTVLVLRGSNFGPAATVVTGSNASSLAASTASGNCVFLPWAYRPATAAMPVCNGVVDFIGEGELPSSNVIWWDHEVVVVLTVAGAGTKNVVVGARGGFTAGSGPSASSVGRRLSNATSNNAGDVLFMYGAPTLRLLTPATGDTTGAATLELFGADFGPTPRDTALPADRLLNEGDGSSVSLGLPLSADPTLPSFVTVVRFNGACLTNALDAYGGRTLGLPGAVAASCVAGTPLLVQNTSIATFALPPGVGANISVSVEIWDDPAATAPLVASAPQLFSYLPPTLTSFSPSPLRLSGADASVEIRGLEFGDPTAAGSLNWTQAQQALAVTLGAVPCGDVQRQTVAPYGVVLECSVSGNSTLVGPRNVTVDVGGQLGFGGDFATRTASGADYSPLLIVCDAGYFGRIGETCEACPSPGATCAGYVDTIPPSTEGGLLANPADAPNTYPVALAGFYSLSRTCVVTYHVDGSVDNPCVVYDAGGACPPLVRALFPTRDTCIVGCDPAEACAGANECAPGYASTPPYYRCSTCAPAYFRTGGTCTACPAAPAAQLVLLVLVVLAAGGVGFVLNHHGIVIGCGAIGLDYVQVIAVLAQTNVLWPPAVDSLLRGLSAFNLNIEIVAPECTVPGITFVQKFSAVMLLPLVVAALFGSLHVGTLAYKKLVLRRKGQLNRNLPSLLSILGVTAYVLYLDETRTALEVFNCTPPSPPDGFTYLRSAGEPCGVAGGSQVTLVPWAAIALIVYSVGYPAALAGMWWRHRELIMEDQLLRAKGTGGDRLSNPHAYSFRKSWGRSYFQFRPDTSFWVVMIVLRKLAVAAAAVIFNRDPQFQLAAVLLVLFVAYELQVRVAPYMSPLDHEVVLAAHTTAALTSPLHARLHATLANIEARGRKRTRRNVMGDDGRVHLGAALSALRAWLTNYNTAESTLLFSAIVVCLLGMVYDAASEGTAAYSNYADGIGGIIIAVVALSLAYILFVVGAEAAVLYAEARTREQMQGRKKAASDGSGAAPRASASRLSVAGSRKSLTSSIRLSEPLETGLNPLFAVGGGSGGGGRLSLGGGKSSGGGGSGTTLEDARVLHGQLSALLEASHEAPTPAVWTHMREVYSRTTVALEQALLELAATKREQQQQRGGGAGGDDGAPGIIVGGATVSADGGTQQTAAARNLKAFAPSKGRIGW